jgi:hypothetical protein
MMQDMESKIEMVSGRDLISYVKGKITFFESRV